MEDMVFEFLRRICGYGEIEQLDKRGKKLNFTCKHDSNIPEGCKCGKCNEELCPVLKKMKTNKDKEKV